MVDKTLTQRQEILKLKQENNALKKQISYAFDELERQLNFRNQDAFTIINANEQLKLREKQVCELEGYIKKLLDTTKTKSIIVDNIARACDRDLKSIHTALTSNITIFNHKKRIKQVLEYINQALKDYNELIKLKENETKNNNIR